MREGVRGPLRPCLVNHDDVTGWHTLTLVCIMCALVRYEVVYDVVRHGVIVVVFQFIGVYKGKTTKQGHDA